MATTDFLQWNPTQANQEDDATYLADTQRTNGIALDDIMPSARMNKMFYQWSTFIAAFCQMLVAKGFSTSDASLSALVTVLGNILTTADVSGTGIVTVAWSATPTFTVTATDLQFFMQLTGNVTSSTLSGVTPGQKITFLLKQDVGGGHTFAWPSNVYGGGALDTTPGACNSQIFEVYPDSTVRAVTPMIVT